MNGAVFNGKGNSMKNKFNNYISVLTAAVMALSMCLGAVRAENGYLIYDDFTKDTLKEWSFNFDGTEVEIEDGFLKFKGPENTSKFPSVLRDIPASEADILIVEYNISSLGSYCPNTLFLTFDGSGERQICRNGHKGDTTVRTGNFKSIVNFKEGTAVTYLEGQDEPVASVSVPSGPVVGMKIQNQTYNGSTTSYDYIKIYDVSDSVEILEKENAGTEAVDIVFSPIIPADINLNDYITVENAQIESITQKNGGVYTVKFTQPLENEMNYILTVDSMPCLYDITISKTVDFKTRAKKKEINIALENTDFSEFKNEDFRVVKKINLDIINELDVESGVLMAVLYDETGKMLILNPYNITTETQSTQKNLTFTQALIADNMRLELYVADSIENIRRISGKTVYKIQKDPESGEYTAAEPEIIKTSGETAETSYDFLPDADNGRIKFTVIAEKAEAADINFVMLKGYDAETENEPEYKRNNIYYLEQKPLENGSAEFNIVMPDVSADYTVYYGGAGEEMKKTVVKYYDTGYIQNAFDILNSAPAEAETGEQSFKEAAEQYAEVFGIKTGENGVYTLAAALRDEQGGFVNKNNIKEVFDAAEKIYTKNGGNVEEFLQFINSAYVFDEKVWSVYEKSISGDAAEAVKTAILGTDFKNIGDIKTQFAEFTVLCGIEKAEHYTQVSEIIKNLGESVAGLSLKTYNGLRKKSSVDSALTRQHFENFGDLKTEFERLVEEYGNTGGGAGGSGGGSSSGGYQSGVTYVPEVNQIPDKPENKPEDNPKTHKFDDLKNVQWAAEAVAYLFEAGVVAGKSESKFAPDDKVTRGELAKMISLAMKLEKSGKADFEDIDSASWCAEYVDTVFSNGIMNGTGEKTFSPQETLTREMIASVIYRAALSAGKMFGDEIKFDDIEAAEPYAREAIAKIAAAGIVSGTGENMFSPKNDCTRAQAAKMIFNLMQFVD